MTTLMSVRRHLLVGTSAVWKPVHWLALPAGGPVCTCCDFLYWRVFSNGSSGRSFQRFFSVIVILNAKFVLDLGMVRIEGFSNIGVSLGCSHYFYTKVCSQMTSGGDLCHVGASKLISKTNRWTGPCVIQFLPEGRSETMLHHWFGSEKYPTVLCFGIGRGDARFPVPFPTWGLEGFWSVLWCAESLQDWGVFSILV